MYENLSECPYVRDQECYCAFGDTRGQCAEYSIDSRYFQQGTFQPAYYSCESHDVEPDGDRYNTSYPSVSYSQSTTAWWDNFSELPGAGETTVDSRYETTYDRLRSASGLPVMQLLYNYDVLKKTTVLGVYVAFENDGLMFGYSGCRDPGHPSYAAWNSNVDNGAFALRPELCPLGKSTQR